MTATATRPAPLGPEPGPEAGTDPSGGPRRPNATPPGAVERLPLLLTAVIGSGVAGWGFSRVLEPSAAVWPVLVGALVPALLLAAASLAARAVARPTPPATITVPLSLLLAFVAGPFVADRLAQAAGPVTGFDALRAFGGTWRTLLTTTLPAAADAPTVLALLLVVWMSSLIAGEAALRSRFALLPFVPAVLVLGVAVALGLPAGGSAMLLSAVLVVVGALHVALARALPAPGASGGVMAPSPDTLSAVYRVVSVCVVAALAALVGTVVGPRLPWADQRAPFDPRQYVQPPQESSAGQSPLSRVSSWLAGPVRPLFAVDGDLGPTDTLRWVSLDRYDGTAWTTDEAYVVAGPRLPDGPEGDRGLTSRTVSTRVAVGTLPGPWLPAPDRADAVRDLTVKVAPRSGDVVGTTPATAGSVYSVDSTVRDLDDEWVKAAGAGSAPFLDGLRSVPDDLPDNIGATAEEAVAGATSDIQRLLLLEQWMRKNLLYDPAGLPGHSAKTLGDFVAPEQSGTMEQFAAAYAVMARHLGYASRVTVAFTPGTAADDPARIAPVEGAVAVDSSPLTSDPDLVEPTRLLGGEGTEVTTRDVVVFPEVWLGELGWRAFYPVPVPGASADQEIVQGLGAEPDTLDLTDISPQSGPGTQADVDPPELQESGTPLGFWAGVALAGVTLVGALLVWVLGVLVVTHLRRRRRRASGTPRERVLAAWREVQDGLSSAGVDRVRTMTGQQAVAAGSRLVGEQVAAPLTAVSGAATRALFGRDGVDEAAAAQAWESADAVDRQVRRHRGWKGRLVDAVAPGRG